MPVDLNKFFSLLSAKWQTAIENDQVKATPSGTPILMDDANSVVDVSALSRSTTSMSSKREAVRRFLSKHRSRSYRVSERNAGLLLSQFSHEADIAVLVVGGGTVGPGLGILSSDPRVHYVAFDIYDSPNINFIADGHAIPLADEVIDIVWIQAVLEHVVDPRRVAAECDRVLKLGGMIYAETPFIQQVHAERYDFTRFTGLGHRMLFPHFETVSAGVVDGPGVALAWSIRYFFQGLFRSRNVGRVAGLAFAWLKYFDLVIPESHQQMAASAFYFIGRKRTDGKAASPAEMLAEYAGV